MAPETLFLALQCVQCATMQVKPQKKSSNKWVCVVCNQRQSVLRIYARGYRAADLRRFVQEANLARGRRELMPEPEEECCLTATAEEQQQDEIPMEKKRTDWSEYLDDPGERNGRGGVEEGTPDGVSSRIWTPASLARKMLLRALKTTRLNLMNVPLLR